MGSIMKRPEQVEVINQVKGFPGSGTHGKLDTTTGVLIDYAHHEDTCRL